MHSRLLVTIALASLGALAGCAHSQSPVLYPNAKLQQVGKEQADRGIGEIEAQLEKSAEEGVGADQRAAADSSYLVKGGPCARLRPADQDAGRKRRSCHATR